MARDIVIAGSTVKVRHPLAPLGLGIITLGVYPLVWYVRINAELRSQGEEVSPGVALLAITLGAILIVPPFVSLYNTAERIRRVQVRNGVEDPISAVLALVLLFVPVANLFQSAYLQAGLNRAWERAAGDVRLSAALAPPAVDPPVGAV
jgi:hypothetical protein